MSALSSDYGIDSDGKLILPNVTGGALIPQAIPPEAEGRVPGLPEDVALAVSQESGTLISEVPEFFRVGIGTVPQIGWWRLEMAQCVDVRPLVESGTIECRRTLFVDHRGRLGVPSPTQPTVDTLSYPDRETGGLIEVEVPRREGYPRDFVLVSAALAD